VGLLAGSPNPIRSQQKWQVFQTFPDFTDRGVPRTTERQKWCSQQRDDFKARLRSLTIWQLALLDPDRTFAKYDYWSKAAFFSLDEVLWLSVGLQPLPEFIQALDHPSQRTLPGDAVVAHMVAQRELFSRSLDPNGFDRRQTAQSVLDWANLVQHELHPGFRRMLETMVQRKAGPEVSVVPAAAPSDAMPVGAIDPPDAPASLKSGEKRIDPRERLGMAKLLVGMAIDQYGYQPNDGRGPIPKELQGILDRLGLNLSQNTIRTYLRLGASQLPKGWKQDD